jgi:hypothetical protein
VLLAAAIGLRLDARWRRWRQHSFSRAVLTRAGQRLRHPLSPERLAALPELPAGLRRRQEVEQRVEEAVRRSAGPGGPRHVPADLQAQRLVDANRHTF